MTPDPFYVTVETLSDHSLGVTARYKDREAHIRSPWPFIVDFYERVFGANTLSDAHEIGQKLFETLFAGETLDLLRYAEGEWATVQRSIPLALECEAEELRAYPWELLYDPEYRRFLSLSRQSALVRYSPGQGSLPSPKSANNPVRVLVTLSSPSKSWDVLNLLQEKKWLRHVFEPLEHSNALEVVYLENATFPALQQRLFQETFDVLHFMGHASYDSTTRQGYLVLEDEIGGPALLPADGIQDLVSSMQFQLMVLNACHTFTQSNHKGALSVAEACIRGGAKAVVSMQAPITDSASVGFSKAFYRSLVAGASPHESMVAARQNLRNATLSFNASWCVPTLFVAEIIYQGIFGVPKEIISHAQQLEPEESFRKRISEIQRTGMMNRLKTHFEYWLLLEEQHVGYGRNMPPRLMRDIEYRQSQIVELQNQLGLDEFPVEWQNKRRASEQKQLTERQKGLQTLQQLASESLAPMERLELQREMEAFECEIEILERSLGTLTV